MFVSFFLQYYIKVKQNSILLCMEIHLHNGSELINRFCLFKQANYFTD